MNEIAGANDFDMEEKNRYHYIKIYKEWEKESKKREKERECLKLSLFPRVLEIFYHNIIIIIFTWTCFWTPILLKCFFEADDN